MSRSPAFIGAFKLHGGKGNRDRDVMLSPRLLDGLHDYWRTLTDNLVLGCQAVEGARIARIHASPDFVGLDRLLCVTFDRLIVVHGQKQPARSNPA